MAMIDRCHAPRDRSIPISSIVQLSTQHSRIDSTSSRDASQVDVAEKCMCIRNKLNWIPKQFPFHSSSAVELISWCRVNSQQTIGRELIKKKKKSTFDLSVGRLHWWMLALLLNRKLKKNKVTTAFEAALLWWFSRQSCCLSVSRGVMLIINLLCIFQFSLEFMFSLMGDGKTSSLFDIEVFTFAQAENEKNLSHRKLEATYAQLESLQMANCLSRELFFLMKFNIIEKLFGIVFYMQAQLLAIEKECCCCCCPSIVMPLEQYWMERMNNSEENIIELNLYGRSTLASPGAKKKAATKRRGELMKNTEKKIS